MNDFNKPILVIGGGISGITTAVEAAETGYKVILIEKLPYLGGRVAKVNQYFPKLCPPYCGLEINFKRIKQSKNITIFTASEVEKIDGDRGNYTVTIKSKPQFINSNCTACGKCADVCPVERNNEFNYNLDTTKAAYLPHEMAFPYTYHIDEAVCEKEACKKCIEACKYNAIDFSKQVTKHEINVGAITIATGWRPYNMDKLLSDKESLIENIVSNVEMERLLSPNGPNNGQLNSIHENVAFIQCAGSRDENHLPYCSGVCCSASLKQALNIAESNSSVKVTIFYIDLRVFGRNEDFLNKVLDHPNITLIKGKAANLEQKKDPNSIIVEAEDILLGKKIKQEFNMVILATGIVPEKIDNKLLEYDEFGFLADNMVDKGIIPVACSKKPLDVSASVKDATGAALKAIQIISNG